MMNHIHTTVNTVIVMAVIAIIAWLALEKAQDWIWMGNKRAQIQAVQECLEVSKVENENRIENGIYMTCMQDKGYPTQVGK